MTITKEQLVFFAVYSIIFLVFTLTLLPYTLDTYVDFRLDQAVDKVDTELPTFIQTIAKERVVLGKMETNAGLIYGSFRLWPSGAEGGYRFQNLGFYFQIIRGKNLETPGWRKVCYNDVADRFDAIVLQCWFADQDELNMIPPSLADAAQIVKPLETLFQLATILQDKPKMLPLVLATMLLLITSNFYVVNLFRPKTVMGKAVVYLGAATVGALLWIKIVGSLVGNPPLLLALFVGEGLGIYFMPLVFAIILGSVFGVQNMLWTSKCCASRKRERN